MAFTKVTSWAALLLLLGILTLLAWFIPADRAKFDQVFHDFRLEIPWSTYVVLSIPDFAFPIAAGLVACAALVAHWKLRANVQAALLHMWLILVCFVLFIVYREVLLRPITMLLRSISSP